MPDFKFKEFNYSPFAAASIGQVHYGVSTDSVKLAVKIQYPGVKESIDSDMENLLRLMTYTRIFPKTLFLGKLVENTR